MPFLPDSRQAWIRLSLALIIGSLGSVGMWSVVVALPAVQADFAASRGAASLAFTLTMVGFGLGGVVAGRLTDRFGIVATIALATVLMGAGYLLASQSTGALAVQSYSRGDRGRIVGDLRAADGGGVALVRAPARHRGDCRCNRQLYRRHALAADCQLGHSDFWLALDAYQCRGRYNRPDAPDACGSARADGHGHTA